MDKGFLISSEGFQKGAIAASHKTSVCLLSWDEFIENTRDIIGLQMLEDFKSRLDVLHTRYWSHSKRVRKDYNLRPEITDSQIYYSGNMAIEKMLEVIDEMENKNYPIDLGHIMVEKAGDEKADNFQQAMNWLNINMNYLDKKLLMAEIEMQINGDFHPKLLFLKPAGLYREASNGKVDGLFDYILEKGRNKK